MWKFTALWPSPVLQHWDGLFFWLTISGQPFWSRYLISARTPPTLRRRGKGKGSTYFDLQ